LLRFLAADRWVVETLRSFIQQSTFANPIAIGIAGTTQQKKESFL